MNFSEELSLIVEAAVDIEVGGDSATAAIISFVKYFQQLQLLKPCSARLKIIILIFFKHGSKLYYFIICSSFYCFGLLEK